MADSSYTSSSSSNDAVPHDRTEQFVALLARSEYRVFSYILTLVPQRADADDLLQRTSIILWRKFSEWQPNTDFTAWACKVAQLEVKNFNRVRSRDRLQFDDDLLESLGDLRQSMAVELDDRHDRLWGCVEKLSARDREIIDGCYSAGTESAKQVAQRLGRPVNTVYKALIRIRRTLHECIERSAEEDRS